MWSLLILVSLCTRILLICYRFLALNVANIKNVIIYTHVWLWLFCITYYTSQLLFSIRQIFCANRLYRVWLVLRFELVRDCANFESWILRQKLYNSIFPTVNLKQDDLTGKKEKVCFLKGHRWRCTGMQ